MQGCSLSCKGTGLNHLFSPIVTRASKARPAHWLPSAEAPGVLKVVETKIRVGPFIPGGMLQSIQRHPRCLCIA